jgi:hypothetical protein
MLLYRRDLVSRALKGYCSFEPSDRPDSNLDAVAPFDSETEDRD